MQRAAKGGLARRLLAGRVPALMAALVVICLAGVLLTLGRGSGVTIERSDGGEAAAGQEADASEGREAAETEASVLVVHVDGCVASPGVYELAGPDLRVNDAVEAAGGLLPEADTSQMNLAAGLSDGQKVLVPARAEEGAAAAAPGGRCRLADGRGLAREHQPCHGRPAPGALGRRRGYGACHRGGPRGLRALLVGRGPHAGLWHRAEEVRQAQGADLCLRGAFAGSFPVVPRSRLPCRRCWSFSRWSA